MSLIEDKSDQQLLQSLLAETAKAVNEVKCAQGDLSKAQSRLSFILMVVNTMINREKV